MKTNRKRISELLEGDIIIDGTERLKVTSNGRGMGYVTSADGTPKGSTRIIEYRDADGKAQWLHEASSSTVLVEA